jgi:hypothetical protein
MDSYKYDVMEIARIGSLFISGDCLEDVMPPDRKEYPLKVTGGGRFALSDEIDFDEDNFNELKKTLLRIERIDPSRSLTSALWIRRPENADLGEVMVAGKGLPSEGYGIIELWPELIRALSGRPTRLIRAHCETIYYPIRNSDEEIVGALELSESSRSMFI